MDILRLRTALCLYLAWLGLSCVVVALCLSPKLQSFLPFLTPENLFQCLAAWQLFFILAIWPLFIPGIFREARAEGAPAEAPRRAGERGEAMLLALQVAAFLLFSIPLALLCFVISGTPLQAFAASQGILLAAAALVGACYFAGTRRSFRWEPLYYVVTAALAGGLPLVHYVSTDYGGQGISAAAPLSPFWALLDMERANVAGPVWAEAIGFYALAAAALAAWGLAARRAEAAA